MNVFETEINAVTDNPNIFEKEDVILSGGNFHGQPLAIAIDFLKKLLLLKLLIFLREEHFSWSLEKEIYQHF